MEKALILIGLLAVFSLDCSSENVECEAENISIAIQFNKTSESCSDIELAWEIIFGARFEFVIDVKCEGKCLDKRIVYRQANSYVIQEGAIISFNGMPSWGQCNEIRNASQTLNMRAENEQGPITFEVGDTVIYEFKDPVFCTSDDFSGCASEEIEVDLPEYTFEYILAPEDFNCN